MERGGGEPETAFRGRYSVDGPRWASLDEFREKFGVVFSLLGKPHILLAVGRRSDHLVGTICVLILIILQPVRNVSYALCIAPSSIDAIYHIDGKSGHRRFNAAGI